MHVDPLIYYRSQKPLDICSLQPVRSMIGERENRATYPPVFQRQQRTIALSLSRRMHLSYARSRDLLHWETSSGRPLALPISRSVGEIVDPAAPGEGLINMVQEVGFDSQGRPVLIFHRYDAQCFSQAWLARVRGKKHRSAARTFAGLAPSLPM